MSGGMSGRGDIAPPVPSRQRRGKATASTHSDRSEEGFQKKKKKGKENKKRSYHKPMTHQPKQQASNTSVHGSLNNSATETGTQHTGTRTRPSPAHTRDGYCSDAHQASPALCRELSPVGSNTDTGANRLPVLWLCTRTDQVLTQDSRIKNVTAYSQLEKSRGGGPRRPLHTAHTTVCSRGRVPCPAIQPPAWPFKDCAQLPLPPPAQHVPASAACGAHGA